MDQFTYPHLIFNEDLTTSDDFLDYFAQTRGVIRANVPGLFLGIFSALITVNRLLNKTKKIYLLVLVICIMGVFYTGARQSVATLLLCVFFIVLFGRDKIGRRKLYPIFLLTGTVILLIIVKFDYIVTLIGATNDDLSGKDTYIRLYEAEFYLFEYWPHWLTLFIGNGWSYGTSAYGKEMYALWSNKHVFREDVGLVGGLNEFGIFHIVIIFRILYEMIFKVKLPNDKVYIKYFFISVFFLSWASQNWFMFQSSIPIFVIVMYLADCYSLKNQSVLDGYVNPQSNLTGQGDVAFANLNNVKI